MVENERRFRDIRAYRVGWLLVICDFLFAFPLLWIWQKRTTKGIKLDYLGDRKQIEQDIKHGAFFMTNHRDIVLDAAWLSKLLRCRYFIRPFIGIGNNLFAYKWIEVLVRFNRCFCCAVRASRYGWRNAKGARKTEMTSRKPVCCIC